MDPTTIGKIFGVYRRGFGKGVGPSGPKHGALAVNGNGNKNQAGADFGINLNPATIYAGILQIN